MTLPVKDFDVVVIGAGPVGLALAIEMGMRGVRVLVAERNSRGGLAPRAKTTNARTRTHLRRWGIADALAAASPLGGSYPNDIHFVTSLSGYPLAVFRNAFNAAPDRADAYPEHAQWVPQYTLERVMLEHALTLPSVDLRFETTFLNAEQDADTVTTRLQDSAGDVSAFTSRYLVGADGARSAVRDRIGATMQGAYGISRHSNVVFHAPGLAQAQVHGPGVMFLQIGPAGLSITGPMDKGDIWYFGTNIRDGEPLSDDKVIEQIKLTTGIDLPYRILSADQWTASELIADKYSEGRIILAGDACHLHPPFGGYGMNMGVGDAVDLGWKIAAELQGWGGPSLVAAYEAERRPVHRFVMEEALANHQMMLGSPWRDGLDAATPEGEALRREVGGAIQVAKAREYHTLGTVLGLGYEGSPIIDSEPEPAPPHDGQHYTPSARPGRLAPHGWLEDGRSLYDAFGPGFALVVADAADETQVALAAAEALALGAPLEIVRPGPAITDLYHADLTLVRPDQHVAWRGKNWNGALRRAVALVGAVESERASHGV
jgi:2-polyprenyl-6-methoxyphenol hydroxylase-like FAD-dependent oxidoreductase